MMPGTIFCTATGGLVLEVEGYNYQILPEDVQGLIFAGQPAPILRERVQKSQGGLTGDVVIEGHAAMSRSGRAVVVQILEGAWVIPFVSFQRLARMEAISAPLFAVVRI